MYLFFGIVLSIIAAIGLALLIGIVMALREGAGTREDRGEHRQAAGAVAEAIARESTTGGLRKIGNGFHIASDECAKRRFRIARLLFAVDRG
jgi:hypothetical protein